MNNGSVGALHVALAAAFVGWIVFSLCHSVVVWQKRNINSSSTRSVRWLVAALLLCCVALAGGWLNRELERRAGIISGTDFFVVRARGGAIPHLTDKDSIGQGVTLADFDSPEKAREEERLRGEIAVLEEQMKMKRLQPLVLNPEILRRSQEMSEVQRARLTELGFGVLGAEKTDKVPIADPVSAERAKSEAANLDLERTKELVKDGILPRQRLETAIASAQTAAQTLREREQLVRVAESGVAAQTQMETVVRRDGDRAQAERTAEISELEAQLAERRNDLFQLIAEEAVKAPFGGNVVYRNPSPALAASGQVILAIARGAGFVATIQVPARDASMLAPGQKLALKLEHSLVSEEISGRLSSIRPAPESGNRATLLIECNLPPEQFAAFSSESVPVRLEWRPPLWSDHVTQFGVLLACFVAAVWLLSQMRAALRSSIVEARPAVEPERELVTVRMSEKDPLRPGAFAVYQTTHSEGWPERVRGHVDEVPSVMARAVEKAGSVR